MAKTEEELNSALIKATPLQAFRDKRAKNEILAYADKLFSVAKHERMSFEREWYLNLAFYFGKHYVEWAVSPARDFYRLYEPPAPPWRVRLVTNRVKPIIRKELAKITKEKPRGYVIAASSEEEDMLAARAAEEIQEHLWREKHMNRVIRQAVFWAILTGSGFIKDYYDALRTDFSDLPGDIIAERITPWHLYIPDAQEEDIESEPYVIHAMLKDKDWVKEHFPNSDITEDSSSGGDILEQKFLSALGIRSNPKKDKVIVKEAWIKPSAKFREGAYIMWGGGDVLQFEETWPYNHKEYPFTKIDHIPTGRFYGQSIIVDLIPLQKEYNRTRSQMIESKNRMSKPQLLAPKGSVDPRKITSEPGLIIFYTPGFTPPTPLPMQDLPGYVTQEVDRIKQDMDDISAQHEIARGSVPPGVTAATAIAFLQEEDDTTLAHTIVSLEEGVQKISRHFLNYVHQFWDMPRLIRITGENGQYEAYQFSKSDLRNNTDFRVEPGSATPLSRAAKQAFIMELGKMNWIPPDKALRFFGLSDLGRLYEELQRDTRQAQRENLMMVSIDQTVLEQHQMVGQLPEFPVNSWDEHLAHIDSHDGYRKTPEYMKYSDPIKAIFNNHVELHKVAFAASLGIVLSPGDMRLNAIVKGLPLGGFNNEQSNAEGSLQEQKEQQGQQEAQTEQI